MNRRLIRLQFPLRLPPRFRRNFYIAAQIARGHTCRARVCDYTHANASAYTYMYTRVDGYFLIKSFTFRAKPPVQTMRHKMHFVDAQHVLIKRRSITLSNACYLFKERERERERHCDIISFLNLSFVQEEMYFLARLLFSCLTSRVCFN